VHSHQSIQYRSRLIGQRFGQLVVKSFSHLSKGKKTVWLCKCDCGIEKAIRNDCLTKGCTRSCGCLQNRLGNKNLNWRGYGELGAARWHRMIKDAKKRNISFNITMQEAWDKFLQQNRLCALSGLPLRFGKRKDDYSGNASLDRIDSSFGYETNNIQWVDKRINTMKMGLSQPEFLFLCSIIHKHSGA
jgi:Na+/citrate or Na+/malate symporter